MSIFSIYCLKLYNSMGYFLINYVEEVLIFVKKTICKNIEKYTAYWKS